MMNRLLPLTALAAWGCAGLIGRETYLREGGFDIQCPERAQVDTSMPAGWKVLGTTSATGQGQIVYELAGRQVTWCQYSEEVWEQQKAAIHAGQAPSLEVDGPERQALLAKEAYQADADAERQSYEERRTVERAQEAESRASQQRQVESAVQAREIESRRLESEKRAVTVAGLRLAQRYPLEVVSLRVCELEQRIQGARDDLAREQRIGRESGTTDLVARHEAGQAIVDAQDELAEAKASLKRALRSAPKKCSPKALACVEGMACAALSVARGLTDDILQGTDMAGPADRALAELPPEEATASETTLELAVGMLR